MTTKEIWMLPEEQRMQAFLDRYLELDEMTGNRTLREKDEMADIADAVMPTLIKVWSWVKAQHIEMEP
jgi:hypothetical protein